MPDYMYHIGKPALPGATRGDAARAGVGPRAGFERLSDGRRGSRSDFRHAHSRFGFHGRRESTADGAGAGKGRRAGRVGRREDLRHYELIFAGDVDGSISAARDEVYERPGAKPEVRWSTMMEDLRRRDFSVNAVAISLNPASRGLLLDPTNGLADLEKREVRALSIHAFTNQPIRLMRILRYAARMDFKMEQRTAGMV